MYRGSKFHGSLKRAEMISDSKMKTPGATTITTSNSQSEPGSTVHEDVQTRTCSVKEKCYDCTDQQSAETVRSHSVPRTEGEGSLASNHIQQTIPTVATTAASVDGPVCILCDEPATVRLLPCGHEIICLICSKRAKKCLQCKVLLLTIIILP